MNCLVLKNKQNMNMLLDDEGKICPHDFYFCTYNVADTQRNRKCGTSNVLERKQMVILNFLIKNLVQR